VAIKLVVPAGGLGVAANEVVPLAPVVVQAAARGGPIGVLVVVAVGVGVGVASLLDQRYHPEHYANSQPTVNKTPAPAAVASPVQAAPPPPSLPPKPTVPTPSTPTQPPYREPGKRDDYPPDPPTFPKPGVKNPDDPVITPNQPSTTPEPAVPEQPAPLRGPERRRKDPPPFKEAPTPQKPKKFEIHPRFQKPPKSAAEPPANTPAAPPASPPAPPAVPAAPASEPPASKPDLPLEGRRFRQGRGLAQAEGAEGAREQAIKKRAGQRNNPEWEDSKVPKQQDINSTVKSTKRWNR